MHEENYARENRLPDPIYDDGILRCTKCIWEVVDVDEELELVDMDATTLTECGVLHPDRWLIPRGGTPLLEVEQSAIRDRPERYSEEEEMYEELLSRGATRRMCERYDLEFHAESGILAWADEDLFDDFTGDLVREGDRWQIYIGRYLELNPNDEDGALFMSDLIEEAMVFRHRESNDTGWETVLMHRGRRNRRVWVTRPSICPAVSEEDSDSSSSSEDEDKALPYEARASIFADEYEDESESEDEGMDVDPSYVNGEIYEYEAGPEVTLPDSGWNADVHVENGEEYSEDYDSDEPGSDWDSDEIMSGDEIAVPYLAQLRQDLDLREDGGMEEHDRDNNDNGYEARGGNGDAVQPRSGSRGIGEGTAGDASTRTREQ